ncbi:EamA family transporter [Pseudanabaena sp. 'Roaring Creek']|uniref:EamA family transporter n=1 Tax=Pseudanabaena sp. 'Roaring Creek' TaxID=1681830 RepID=UPI0006D8103B|nr:EamA family transporter [Pseudanabaena sp. 'Roaring Creek']
MFDRNLLLLLAISLVTTGGHILFKKGAVLINVENIFTWINPALIMGMFLYAIGTVLWVFALRFIPLSKAYPFTFLTFILVTLFSVLFFGDKITPWYITGMGLIFMGLVLTSLKI